jgi:hypothetical protein
MDSHWNNEQRDLPKATLVLILGIISIVGCCCTYGVAGIVCGIITIVLARSEERLYLESPERYTISSYKNLKTGRICAWIGLIPSIAYVLYMAFLVATLGFGVFTDPSLIYEYFGLDPVF